MDHTNEPAPRLPLRLWPGVAIGVLVLVLRFVLPAIAPSTFIVGLLAGIAGLLLIVLWWVLFSRAPWVERLGAMVLMIAAIFATKPLLHKSIATGMMGRMFFVYAVPPVLGPAFAFWALATRRLSNGARRASMAAVVFLACAVWALFRTDGIMGETGSLLAWRWTKSAEERLLESGDEVIPPAPAASVPVGGSKESADEPSPAVSATVAPREAAPAAAAPSTPPSTAPVPALVSKRPTSDSAIVDTGVTWPGFRGAARDGTIRGIRIDTNWSTSPPIKMWQRPIGPGWSSFAVRGDFLYTQEQRGDDELVSSYRVSTGEPVWRHRDAVRFWESNGGAGPRATPTLSGGRVYTFGATGILNALNASNGSLVWSSNVSSDTSTKVPMWGFASSPLVVGDTVIVAASGKFAAYGIADGKLRWSRPTHGGSYSSPHRLTIDGIPQVLLLSAGGATSVAPDDGRVLWESLFAGDVTIVQPAVIADGDILISTAVATGGVGTRRLAVAHRPDGWSVVERWTSAALKPYFNDFVVHKGHAYGFDGSILACVDLEDGKRKWKGGRYGNGQLVLLPDQDLLLVLSEEGELALVKAADDQFTEIARMPALEGKTWNHPVVAGDVLLVRNGEEMAAFRLFLEGR